MNASKVVRAAKAIGALGLTLAGSGVWHGTFAENQGSWAAEDPVTRTRILIEYENKLRLFAEPEKRFNYFASQSNASGQTCMSFEDFVLSVTPSLRRGAQPGVEGGSATSSRLPSGASGGLGLKPTETVLTSERRTGSVLDLVDSSGDGLISFPEYLFCMALLTIPPSDFELAFRIFDIDGDGNIDADEFENAMERMRGRSSLTAKDRFEGELRAIEGNDALMDNFFGRDRTRKLSFRQFSSLIERLQREVLLTEFSFLDRSNTNAVCIQDFVQAILIRPGSTPTKDDIEPVTLDEWQQFDSVIRQLDRVQDAVAIYAGRRIGQPPPRMNISLFAHLIRAATGISVRHDMLVALSTALTESDDDGQLDVGALFAALSPRQKRFTPGSPSTGLIGYLSCLGKCRLRSV